MRIARTEMLSTLLNVIIFAHLKNINCLIMKVLDFQVYI